MNDILFGNNNGAIINRLAKSNFSANRRRNLFATITLALTAFMITSVFSIGFSYFETYQLQQLRFMGTTADAAITNPTEEQLRQMETSNFISDIGISHRLGSVDTSAMKDALLGIVQLSDTEWEKHRFPTVSSVKGEYPTAQNEIMLPTWVLEQMGITAPKLGMAIELSYQLEAEQHYITEEFVLSGYYTDYMSSRTNNRGAVYVSAAFRDAAKLPLTSGGSAMITFSNDDIERNCNKLKDTIGLAQGQSLEIVPSSGANGEMLVFALALIILLIAFSGYLLIYNIFYISVSRDTRFFGQLKTLGATKRQIKRIVYRQVLRTSIMGIPIGLFFGGIFSLGVVPYVLNMLYSINAESGTKISFSPVVFIGAAVFTLLTAIIGSRKPTKLAGSISPIAAMHYTGTEKNKGMSKRKRHEIKLPKMAWNNIFREKKSAALVFTSLFLGLCLFLVITGILSGLSPENFVKQWGESDFVLTYGINDDDTSISEEMLTDINRIDGIDHMRLTYVPATTVTMNVVYDETVFGNYIKSLDGKSGIDFSTTAKLEAYTQNFYSGIYGIDRAYVKELNREAEHPVDMERFESGEIVLLSELQGSDGKDLIQSGQKITVKMPNEPHTFIVADSFLASDFQSGRGHMGGTAPDIFISQNALKEFFPAHKIFRVAFDTDGKEDSAILRQLKAIVASEPEIEIISRYEKEIEMGGYITTTKVLGMGLSLVLLLIGVMNFINTMVVSVNTRRHEIAILESIGMTKKQIKKVLLYEGCYYFGISFALVAILGTGLYTLIYFAFKQFVPYAVFAFPILPLILISVLVLIICLSVPIMTYKSELKNSVVERLRITE